MSSMGKSHRLYQNTKNRSGTEENSPRWSPLVSLGWRGRRGRDAPHFFSVPSSFWACWRSSDFRIWESKKKKSVYSSAPSTVAVCDRAVNTLNLLIMGNVQVSGVAMATDVQQQQQQQLFVNEKQPSSSSLCWLLDNLILNQPRHLKTPRTL